jgi:hypothetical protein
MQPDFRKRNHCHLPGCFARHVLWKNPNCVFSRATAIDKWLGLIDRIAARRPPPILNAAR